MRGRSELPYRNPSTNHSSTTLCRGRRVPVTVTTIYRDEVEAQAARGGENLRLRLNGVDEDDIAAGFVICSRSAPVPCVTYFDAQLQILDLLEHKVRAHPPAWRGAPHCLRAILQFVLMGAL